MKKSRTPKNNNNNLTLKNATFFSLGTLALITAILSLAIALTIWNIPMYTHFLNKFNLGDKVNLSNEQVQENYIILLKYLHLPWIHELNMPDFPSSELGAFHFYEVKQLFYLEYIVLIVSCTASFFFLKKLHKGNYWAKLKNTFLFLAILPLGIIILITTFFDKIFLLFHKSFFNNDAWLFNPASDPIINVLPQEFFMACFLQVFITLEITLIVLFIISWRAYKKSNLK